MAITVKIDQVSASNGRVYIRCGKKTMEFSSAADAAASLRLREEEMREFLLRLLVTEWVRRNPQLNNPGQITQIEATYDLSGTLTPLTFRVV